MIKASIYNDQKTWIHILWSLHSEDIIYFYNEENYNVKKESKIGNETDEDWFVIEKR